jgi:hypothetical protein
VNMNGFNTKADLNIISLGSYDCVVGVDWIYKHHIVLHCYINYFTFLDEEGKLRTIYVFQG